MISKILNVTEIFSNFHIYNNVMFYFEIPWFYQDLKRENLRFLNLYSIHGGRILDLSLEIMLSPPR